MGRTTQISVSLPNKRGQLAELCGALAAQKVNILAISVAENTDLGTVRMVVSKPDAAAKKLDEMGLTYAQSEVLMVRLPHKIGALAEAAAKLRKARVDISYVYGSTGSTRGNAAIVVATANLKAAEKALGGK